MVKIGIIIVTFNSKNVIKQCLDSLPNNYLKDVIVVDNNSIDDTIKIIQKDYPQIPIIKNKHNLGYAQGNNLGIEQALKNNPEYILILNPDVRLEPDTLDQLVKFADTKKNKGIFGPVIFSDNKLQTVWSRGGILDKKRYTAKLVGYKEPAQCVQSLDFISGTCMLMPVQVLNTGLRFHEPYFMYYEDIEFCLRAKTRGYPAYLVDSAKIVHFETSQTNNFKKYYLARNHLLFVGRNAPLGVKLREIVRLPKTLWEHYDEQDLVSISGIRDYLLGKFGERVYEEFKIRQKT